MNNGKNTIIRRITVEVLCNKNAQDEWMETAPGDFLHCLNVYASRIAKLTQEETDWFRFGVMIGAVYELWKEKMEVLFSELPDFLEELQAEFGKERVENVHVSPPKPILRVTGAIKAVSPLRVKHLYACASYVNKRGEIVRFEKHCGNYSLEEDKARSRMEEIGADIKAKAEELGMEIRGGIFAEEIPLLGGPQW
jgi:hypothetical protein